MVERQPSKLHTRVRFPSPAVFPHSCRWGIFVAWPCVVVMNRPPVTRAPHESVRPARAATIVLLASIGLFGGFLGVFAVAGLLRSLWHRRKSKGLGVFDWRIGDQFSEPLKFRPPETESFLWRRCIASPNFQTSGPGIDGAPAWPPTYPPDRRLPNLLNSPINQIETDHARD